MRISDGQLHFHGQRAASRARVRLDEASMRVATGVRVARAGDDPASARTIESLSSDAARLTSQLGLARRARGEVATAEGALSGVMDALARARTLAVQMSSDTYGAAERAAAALEVDGLIDLVTEQLNTQSAGRYLFGGHATAAPPFARDGTYMGDDGQRTIDIAPGVRRAISVRADAAFAGADGGVNLLGSLQDLRERLALDDAAAVGGGIAALDAGIDQVSSARATLGAVDLQLESAAAVQETLRTEVQDRLSGLRDVDLVEASSELAHARFALDAALTATARSLELSLVKKL